MPISTDDILKMDTIVMQAQQATFPMSPITDTELANFNAGFDELFFVRGGLLRDIYNSRKGHVLGGLRAAKQQLKNKTFGGFSAANTEIGMTPIRPGHIGFTSTNTAGKPNNVWLYTFGQGNTQWIGQGTATPLTMGQNLFCVNIGLLDLGPSPVSDAVKIDIGRGSLLPIDVHQARINDVPGVSAHVAPLPVTYWPTSENISLQVWSDNGGVTELVPLGYTFGLGTVLSNYPTFSEANRTA